MDVKKALKDNGQDWYVVTYDDKTVELKHQTALSSILECGMPKSDFGIVDMQQCGLHGMTGHQNALKGDEPASSVLTVRVTPSDKARWVKAAQKNGSKLSEWVIRTLNGET